MFAENFLFLQNCIMIYITVTNTSKTCHNNKTIETEILFGISIKDAEHGVEALEQGTQFRVHRRHKCINRWVLHIHQSGMNYPFGQFTKRWLSLKVFKGLMGVPRDFSASALFVNLNVCNFAILRRKLVYSF